MKVVRRFGVSEFFTMGCNTVSVCHILSAHLSRVSLLLKSGIVVVLPSHIPWIAYIESDVIFSSSPFGIILRALTIAISFTFDFFGRLLVFLGHIFLSHLQCRRPPHQLLLLMYFPPDKPHLCIVSIHSGDMCAFYKLVYNLLPLSQVCLRRSLFLFLELFCHFQAHIFSIHSLPAFFNAFIYINWHHNHPVNLPYFPTCCWNFTM